MREIAIRELRGECMSCDRKIVALMNIAAPRPLHGTCFFCKKPSVIFLGPELPSCR